METPYPQNPTTMRFTTEEGARLSVISPQKSLTKKLQACRIACIETLRATKDPELRTACGQAAKACERAIVDLRDNHVEALDACLEACDQADRACQQNPNEQSKICLDAISRARRSIGEYLGRG